MSVERKGLVIRLSVALLVAGAIAIFIIDPPLALHAAAILFILLVTTSVLTDLIHWVLTGKTKL